MQEHLDSYRIKLKVHVENDALNIRQDELTFCILLTKFCILVLKLTVIYSLKHMTHQERLRELDLA